MFPAGQGRGEAERFCQPLAAAAAPGGMDWGFGLQAMSLYPRGRAHQASYTSSHFPRMQAYFLTSPGAEVSPAWELLLCIQSF